MSQLANTLTHAWQRRGLLARLLWPVSLVLAMAVRLRRWALLMGWMSTTRLPAPVLVVGNRIVGGAGKTPTTIAILAHLKQAGWHPGVLSRGYKATASDAGKPTLLDAQTESHLDATQTGDEPLLIWRRTRSPVMIGRQRAASGQSLLVQHPEIDILVCDDGLQHLHLQRDIEVIVFDERGAGNGWLLPAGPLREPIDTPDTPGLVAPPIVLYNADQPSTPLPGYCSRKSMAPLVPLATWWSGQPHQSQPQQPDRAQAIHALAGIAQPQRFFSALAGMGYPVQGIALPDHADFGELPWRPEVTQLIVTEKDAIKLDPTRLVQERPHTQVWVAALDFQPDDRFWEALDAALTRAQARFPQR
jgi:tetraacyldisaccharide 4'-kinase